MNTGKYPFLRNPWWIASVLLSGAIIFWISGESSQESEAIVEVVRDEKPEGFDGPSAEEMNETIEASADSRNSLTPTSDERLAKIEERLADYRKERLQNEAQSTPPETREQNDADNQ